MAVSSLSLPFQFRSSPKSHTRRKFVFFAAASSEVPLLQVNDLRAKIVESNAEILRGVNLTINRGEIHAIMGKNGSGKSTFAKVLVGHPDYEVTSGSVVFKGENLLEMEPEERALEGLFMSFQSPVAIPGVSNDQFLVMAYNARRKKLGLPELGPLEVHYPFIYFYYCQFLILLIIAVKCCLYKLICNSIDIKNLEIDLFELICLTILDILENHC